MPAAESQRQATGLRRVRHGGDQLLVAVSSRGLHPVGRTLAELLAEGAEAPIRSADAACAGDVLEGDIELLSPIDKQEVWGAGVTYERSREARKLESVDDGDAYDRVYLAERPELFFKAPAWRVPAPGQPLRLRADSNWDVPEPELGVVVAADGKVAAYLVGDDLTSRSIEAANPLYLPQAKVYDDSVALSETLTLARDNGGSELDIQLTIRRDSRVVFRGGTSTGRMRRSISDLCDQLFRETSFPDGVVLLTGTGIVPPDDLTLEPGDEVEIEIDGVGSLRHGLYRRKLDQ